jgi:hypothetical protein
VFLNRGEIKIFLPRTTISYDSVIQNWCGTSGKPAAMKQTFSKLHVSYSLFNASPFYKIRALRP